MSFGDDLEIRFQSEVSRLGSAKIGEVLLFTALANAFRSFYYNGIKCTVIHGRKSFVDFVEKPSQPFYIVKDRGNKVTCENADLMFVVVKGKALKLCFLQNKYQRSGYSTVTHSFQATMRQFYLLEKRPEFENKGYKYSILLNATHESIGSYGVFYKNSSCFDMNYCSAHALAPLPSYKGGKSATLKMNTTIYKNSNINGDIQCNFTSGIKEFGDELAKWTIGNPIKISNIGGFFNKEIIQILDDWGLDASNVERTDYIVRSGNPGAAPYLTYKYAILMKLG